MKYDIQAKLYRISILLEILVGVSIAVAIGMSLIGLIADIHPIQLIADPDSLQGYLTTAMTIIIGVEFVKMIFSHSIDSVVEVMLLAVARQMVVEHTSPFENLMAVSSVALLYVVRKFLFIRQLDEVPSHPDSLIRDFLGKNIKHHSSKPQVSPAESAASVSHVSSGADNSHTGLSPEVSDNLRGPFESREPSHAVKAAQKAEEKEAAVH